MRYVQYEHAAAMPNVVVDGSPNVGTVLCLSHWPGIAGRPADLVDDLSAQMAFRYVESGMDRHGDAEIVTNNHFDQDGLVGVYALLEPGHALAHRALLEDVAAAGDFGTYRDRRAMRIAAVLAEWSAAAGDTDPFPAALERLPSLLDDLEPYRPLWEDEDARLSASEAALAAGRIAVTDEPDIDLAVVHIADDLEPTWGRRFTRHRFEPVHPMAVNNATDMSTLAIVHRDGFRLTHRYETWVQYRSRPRRPRVDLAPLAAALTELDSTVWRADDVDHLAPTMSHAGPSSIGPGRWLDLVREHLATAPVAWDPAVGRVGGRS